MQGEAEHAYLRHEDSARPIAYVMFGRTVRSMTVDPLPNSSAARPSV